jgi:hypothetical protein
MVKDMIARERLRLLPDVQQEAQTIRFEYDSKGRQSIVSKEKMRAKGIASPDHWDAIRMAVSETVNMGSLQKIQMNDKYSMGGMNNREIPLNPFFGCM